MKLRVSDIRASHTLSVEEDIPSSVAIGTPPEFVSFGPSIHVAASARLSETDVLVNGTAESSVALLCGRCLENYSLTLKVKFSQIYPAADEIIDLREEIRDSLLVELPLQFLCKSNCEGICPRCGANKNQTPCQCTVKQSDPRWSTLNHIRLKNKE